MTRSEARRRPLLLLLTVLLTGTLAAPALPYARPGAVNVVSLTAAGKPGNADSGWGTLTGDRANGMGLSMTPDGRFLAFASAASDLTSGDTNALVDVFVRDRTTGKLSIASNPTAGSDPAGLGAREAPGAGCAGAGDPAISADGRYVAFDSCALNLVGLSKDTNFAEDVFVRDMKTGTTTRVSVASTGEETRFNEYSHGPSISADGRYVAFESAATNFSERCDTTDQVCRLSRAATFPSPQIYVHDMQTGSTRLVSATAAGKVANGPSFQASISPDGRYVAFVSEANNLAGFDANLSALNPLAAPTAPDVYLKDLRTGSVRLVSVGLDGNAGSGTTPDSGTRFGRTRAGALAISANNRYVAFGSSATNLVPHGAGGGIFVRDLAQNTTRRVSVTSAGESFDGTQTSGGCGVGTQTALSKDGRYVAFVCAPDTACHASYDYVALYDQASGALERVSILPVGTTAADDRCDGSLGDPDDGPAVAISADGRLVAFASNDPSLVHSGTAAAKPPYQVLVRDRGPALGSGRTWTGQAVDGPRTGIPAGFTTPVLTDAALIQRPSRQDYFARLGLTDAAALTVAQPVVGFGMGFEVAGTRYQVDITGSVSGADFRLYRVDLGGRRQLLGTLAGGYGTTGKEIVFAIPVGKLGISPTASPSNVTAYVDSAALGSTNPNPLQLLRLSAKA